MMQAEWRLPVLVVGGGMITEEVILPTLLQEQKRGRLGEIAVASRRAATISRLRKAFPSASFRGYPDPKATPPDESHPDAYRQALAELPAPAAVVVATPDHLHTPVILDAVAAGHHCVVQKPLCLKTAEAHAIAAAAHANGAYVYTDYHKRHDRAIRAARYRFRRGDLGQMLHGHAWIEERREIPLKWFARWCEQSSPFEYIGVHYADAYFFITGLAPRRVMAFGQKKLLPALGKDAFDAVQAVIEWEDGSVLWIQTAWVCSDHQSALTNQGLQLLGTEGEYWADHKNRNVVFVTQSGGFEHYNPNFFKTYSDWDDPEQPEHVGYGYDSIMQGLNDIREIIGATAGVQPEQTLGKRREMIAALEPVRPLPAQALIGTAVNEAVRLSIANGSAWIGFNDDFTPRVL